MIFHCHVNKTHFHKKGWAPNLVLIQRPWGTRKWPIHTRQWLPSTWWVSGYLVKGIICWFIIFVPFYCSWALYCTALAGVGYFQSWIDENQLPHNFLESSLLVEMPTYHSDPMLVSEWRKFQKRMADSISNESENEEVADQLSVWITRSQGTQTNCYRLNWTLRDWIIS